MFPLLTLLEREDKKWATRRSHFLFTLGIKWVPKSFHFGTLSYSEPMSSTL
jgi:hypothetical protein